MTTSTFYGDASDGYIISADYTPTYSEARRGLGDILTAYPSQTQSYCGQSLSGGNHTKWSSTVPYVFQVWEMFLAWDTSTIPDGDSVTSATLSMYLPYDGSSTDFVTRVRAFDWGASLTEADFRSGAPADSGDLAEYVLVATIDSNGIGSTGSSKSFTSESAFVGNVNKTGPTRLVAASARQEAGNEPSGGEYLMWVASDETGTTQDPKLVVVHSVESTPSLLRVSGNVRMSATNQLRIGTL